MYLQLNQLLFFLQSAFSLMKVVIAFLLVLESGKHQNYCTRSVHIIGYYRYVPVSPVWHERSPCNN